MSVGCVKIYEDKIVLGADSIIVYGERQEKHKDAKIKKIDENFGFASSGTAKELEFFGIFCKTHKPSHNTIEGIIDYFFEFSTWKKKKVDDDRIENSYILVYDRKVYFFIDYYVTSVVDYKALGAGVDYATTALHLGHSVEESIKIACELSIYCELPSNIIEFTIKDIK